MSGRWSPALPLIHNGHASKPGMPGANRHTILQLLAGPLPANWPFAETQTQQVGTDWLISRDSIALEIPSIVIPLERNFLLNPTHPRLSEVRVLDVRPFFFDPRIFQTGAKKPAS